MDPASVGRLKTLFEKHSCDKGRMHHYERFYGKIPPPKRMLEVGVFRGKSVRVWTDFWPDSHIVVMDTFQRIPPERIRGLSKVEWHKHNSMEPFGPDDFDLIIDDGDHRPVSQAATFKNLVRNLAPGGRYIIEDVWPWDRMSDYDKQNPWAAETGVSEKAWRVLMEALGGYDVRFHDFRKAGHPDSFLIEVRCVSTRDESLNREDSNSM